MVAIPVTVAIPTMGEAIMVVVVGVEAVLAGNGRKDVENVFEHHPL